MYIMVKSVNSLRFHLLKKKRLKPIKRIQICKYPIKKY
jgi:hypothetical protein